MLIAALHNLRMLLVVVVTNIIVSLIYNFCLCEHPFNTVPAFDALNHLHCFWAGKYAIQAWHVAFVPRCLGDAYLPLPFLPPLHLTIIFPPTIFTMHTGIKRQVYLPLSFFFDLALTTALPQGGRD